MTTRLVNLDHITDGEHITLLVNPAAVTHIKDHGSHTIIGVDGHRYLVAGSPHEIANLLGLGVTTTAERPVA